MGRITGVCLFAEIGDDPNRFDNARGLLALSGLAPVTRSSGGVLVVRRRRIYSQPLGRAVTAWGLPLIQHEPSARAIYDARRASGDRHSAAMRIVLSKYLRALHGCLVHGTTYDPVKFAEGSGLLQLVRARTAKQTT